MKSFSFYFLSCLLLIYITSPTAAYCGGCWSEEENNDRSPSNRTRLMNGEEKKYGAFEKELEYDEEDDVFLL